MKLHVNRILNDNEQFQAVFNCTLNQHRQKKKIGLLPELCATCRIKKNS